MALFFRLTGRVETLQCFPQWNSQRPDRKMKRHSQVFLPTQESAQDYAVFVKADKPTKRKTGVSPTEHNSGGHSLYAMFISEQHSGAAPEIFKNKEEGREACARFVLQLAACGHDHIMEFLDHCAKDSKAMTRGALVRHIERMAARCGENFQQNKDLRFNAHQCLADVESAFPGFAGEVTYDSIGFGHGSEEGRTILMRSKKDAAILRTARRRDGGKSQASVADAGITNDRVASFIELFDMVVTEMLCMCLVDPDKPNGEKKDDGILMLYLAGWRLVVENDEQDGSSRAYFVSIFTGEEFSMTVLEHWCCKIYVCATTAHASRTVSKTPWCYNNYCWPFPTEEPWAKCPEAMLALIKERFLSANVDFHELYPVQLQYPNPVWSS